jgi:hypothetical protein
LELAKSTGTLVSVVVLAACSDGGSDDKDGAKSGSGVPPGTVCIEIGAGTENCNASGNVASRTIDKGMIDLLVSHGGSLTCVTPQLAKADFRLALEIPDGSPFPYTFSQVSGIRSYHFNDGTCGWDSNIPGTMPAMSGTIHSAGTNGETSLDGDVTVQTISVRCGGATVDACPDVTNIRVRFNVPL